MDRKVRAYSLLELMITVLILVVILAIGVPKFLKWQKELKIERDTNLIFSQLQSLREKAALTRSEYEITLSSNGSILIIKKIPSQVKQVFLSTPFSFKGHVSKVKIDHKGIIFPNFTIYSRLSLEASLSPKYDCVVSSGGIRLKKGKWNGSSCR